MNDITVHTAYKILGVSSDGGEFERKLKALSKSAYDTLVGICARLSYADYIDINRIVGTSLGENHVLSIQTERLITYLTITCIDAITGAHYQPFHDWINTSYKVGELKKSSNWNNAVQELTNSNDVSTTEKLLKTWIFRIYNEDYLEISGKKRFINVFIRSQFNWINAWLRSQYHINYHGKVKKLNWDDLSDEEKGERIANYLFHIRNLYTHTIVPYNPLNLSQNRSVKGLSGLLVTYVPLKSSYEKETDKETIEVMLPFEFRESDVIRLLVVSWIRNRWLKFEDKDDFLNTFWKSRKAAVYDL